ncbi:MAG: hypothetical protein QM669_01350 [Siphonobacter sp.]
MEHTDYSRLCYWLNTLIHSHEGRVRVYTALANHTECLLLKPLLMRGISSSILCKNQLVNQLWSYGGNIIYDFIPDSTWLQNQNSYPFISDEHEINLRQRLDENLMESYRKALFEDLPEYARILLISQWDLLRTFTHKLSSMKREGIHLARA